MVNDIEVRPATSLDEIMQCLTLRSAVFVARGEPYDEEFDGNDFTASTHLLAVDEAGRPIGTMRIRAVAGDTVVWERLAVLPQARVAARVLKAIAKCARDYTEFKQYKRVLGAVEDERLIRFWKQFGFRETAEAASFYNGIAYRPIELKLDAPVTRISIKDTASCERSRFTVWLSEKEEPTRKAA